MLCKSDAKETMYGCSENAHFHGSGSSDGRRCRSMAPAPMVGRGITASPDHWSRSHGTTPSTVTGTRTVKMSVFRATIHCLLCIRFAQHQVLTNSSPDDFTRTKC